MAHIMVTGIPTGLRPPTTGSSCTSYNIRRPFLPSVNIDGGRRTAGDGRLFFYFTNMMFERFTL